MTKYIYSRIFLLSFIIILTFIGNLYSQETANLEKVKLQLKWRHQFQFAGYYAALEKGYYKDAGFDVEILPSGPDTNEMEELLAGNAQYMISNSEAVVKYLEGKPIVVLAAIFQHSPAIILSKKESNISTVQDLFGKKLMIQNNIEAAEVLATLRSEGVDEEKYTRVPMTFGLEELLSGSVDAIHAYATDRPYQLQKLGIDYNIIYPHRYGIDFYGDCLITTEKETENRPQRVVKFREASLKGWEYAMKNSQEIIDLIIDKYNSRLNRNELVNEAEAMRNLIFPDLIELGMMNPGRWQTIAQTYADLGFVEFNKDLEGFIYKKESSLDKLLEIVVIITIIGLVLFIISMIWIVQLRRMVARRTEELQQSEKKYRTVIESASDGIIIHQGGLIKLANNSASELLDCSKEYLLDKQIRDFLAPGEIEKIMDNYKKRMEGVYVPQIYLTKLKKLSGGIFEAEINSQLITYEGKPSILVIIRDITLRKEIENKLVEAKEKAEYSDKLKTDFLAQMSHEIRTPINTIFNFLSLIKEEVFNKVPDDIQQCFYLMNSAGKRIVRTIDLILDMSQFREGTYEAKFAKFDLYEKILHNLFLEYKKLAKEKGLNFLFNNDISDYSITADEYTISQIFHNIVDNAVKYTENGHIEINVKRNRENLIVEITDSGIGISEEYLPHLFNPFSQEEQGYTRKYEGNGLGLALVKNYCDLNKAEISVKSKKGEGTTFTIKFNQKISLSDLIEKN